MAAVTRLNDLAFILFPFLTQWVKGQRLPHHDIFALCEHPIMRELLSAGPSDPNDSSSSDSETSSSSDDISRDSSSTSSSDDIRSDSSSKSTSSPRVALVFGVSLLDDLLAEAMCSFHAISDLVCEGISGLCYF